MSLAVSATTNLTTVVFDDAFIKETLHAAIDSGMDQVVPIVKEVVKNNTNLMVDQMNLSDVTSLQELLPIVESAKEEVSFLGYSYIYFADHKTVLPINSLASKTLELVRTTYQYTFTPEERALGKRIAPVITKLYKDNASRVNQKNWFTQALYAIRELWKLVMESMPQGSPGIRYEWETSEFKSVFKYYTENQYKEAFSKDPVGFYGWRDYFGNGPLMWEEL